MKAVDVAIGALAERYALAPGAGRQMIDLLGVVLDDRHAPTALREPERVVRDHFADSLVALEVEEVRDATAIADLGSGAGFPGLPLAIALRGATVALVESNARKCEFITRAAEVAGAGNATAVNSRIEAWSDGRDRFDVVTARALAPLAVVAEYSAPLLCRNGVLVAWRGASDREAESRATRAASELGLEVLKPRHVRPYPEAENRSLHLMVKVGDTPPRFPRRVGVASKRPLGE